MKKKIIIFTLCFTIIFSSLNINKSYADGGVISLPMLAVVSSLAVGSGIILSSDDDLYDLGRMFYDYVKKHNSLTWDSIKIAFNSSVALRSDKLVSVKSEFLDIVKGFFDSSFSYSTEGLIGSVCGVPYYSNVSNTNKPSSFIGYHFNITDYVKSGSTFNIGDFKLTYSHSTTSAYVFNISCNSSNVSLHSDTISISRNFKLNNLYFFISEFSSSDYPYRLYLVTQYPSTSLYVSGLVSINPSSVASIPYKGGYAWDNLENKKENESVALPIPGDLGTLVGQGSTDFWDNTDNLVGVGDMSVPSVDNPTIGLDGVTSFPSVDSDGDVLNPSVPSDGIFSTIKDFIISLVVPNDAFWTDTWGGLYNNFIDSFPMVDMSGFNDLVTGEKKFPNIDINIMGVTGRVVNGDVINSIVDWLRPIIAGFMMICLMLFNYRKIYKLIRNTEPFGGIAPGTSDFKTGISEYTHVGLVNDGFKRSEEEEFARSRYYEEMHFRNGGKL